MQNTLIDPENPTFKEEKNVLQNKALLRKNKNGETFTIIEPALVIKRYKKGEDYWNHSFCNRNLVSTNKPCPHCGVMLKDFKEEEIVFFEHDRKINATPYYSAQFIQTIESNSSITLKHYKKYDLRIKRIENFNQYKLEIFNIETESLTFSKETGEFFYSTYVMNKDLNKQKKKAKKKSTFKKLKISQVREYISQIIGNYSFKGQVGNSTISAMKAITDFYDLIWNLIPKNVVNHLELMKSIFTDWEIGLFVELVLKKITTEDFTKEQIVFLYRAYNIYGAKKLKQIFSSSKRSTLLKNFGLNRLIILGSLPIRKTNCFTKGWWKEVAKLDLDKVLDPNESAKINKVTLIKILLMYFADDLNNYRKATKEIGKIIDKIVGYDFTLYDLNTFISNSEKDFEDVKQIFSAYKFENKNFVFKNNLNFLMETLKDSGFMIYILLRRWTKTDGIVIDIPAFTNYAKIHNSLVCETCHSLKKYAQEENTAPMLYYIEHLRSEIVNKKKYASFEPKEIKLNNLTYSYLNNASAIEKTAKALHNCMSSNYKYTVIANKEEPKDILFVSLKNGKEYCGLELRLKNKKWTITQQYLKYNNKCSDRDKQNNEKFVAALNDENWRPIQITSES